MSVFRRGAHSRRRFCISRNQRNDQNSYKRSVFGGLEKTDFTRRGAHGHVKGAAGVLSKKRYPAFIGAAFAVLLLLVVALPQAYAAIGDAVAPRAVDDHTVSGVSPRGTTINLFDYWVTGNANYDNWDWSELSEAQRNSGINSGHTLKFGKGMGNDPDDNNDLDNDFGNDHNLSDYVANADNVNKWTHSGNPRTNIVQAQLQGGYPVLSDTLGGESLAYLFNTDSGTGKQAYSDVDGLLQVDDQGYYYYNSQDNFAEFNADEQGSGEFSLYETWGVQAAGRSPDGQFFPFNSGNDVFSTTGYGQNEKLTQNNEINSTTNDENVRINHYFGMSMSTRFVQQYDGYTAPEDTEGRQQVTYNFSGDDDVWIYIDGVLVGDLGGIHDATSIQINFATGDVIVYDDSTFRNSDFTPNSDPRNGNNQYDKGERVFKQTTLGVLFDLDGTTFANDTYHTLDFFYLERGNTDSNMSLKYNLVNIPESGVVKVDQSGVEIPGVQFTLHQADENYDIVNGGMTISAVTDANGEMIFTTQNQSGQDMPITLEQLQAQGGDYWVLTEDSVPEGYRTSGSINLRFEGGVLLASNEWDTGAYSQAHVTATAPTTVREYGNHNATHDSSEGVMFAVIMQKGSDGKWYPVSGDAFSGWSVADGNSMTDIVNAAKADQYRFLLGSGGAYEATIENLPGDITKYEHAMANDGDDSTDPDNAQYTVHYYWANAESIDAITGNTNVVRIDADADQQASYEGMDRVFSVTLNVPNIKNELTLNKTNESGENLEGAVYTLYNDTNANGIYDEGIDTVVESQGSVSTGDGTTVTGMVTDATGNLKVYSNSAAQTLAHGTYVLVETKAPSDYQLDETPIAIVVDDDGVHVNAGTETDNVTVETGIGSLVYSMRGFAAGDDVDGTLHDVVATPQTSTSNSYTGDSMIWSDAPDVAQSHYQYDDEAQDLSYRLAEIQGNGTATYTAESGWSRLDIQQCLNHEGTDSPKQNLSDSSAPNYEQIENLNALFTGEVTIHVTNSRIPTDITLDGETNLVVTKNLVGTEWGTDWAFSFTIASYGDTTTTAVKDGVVTMPNPAEITIGADSQNNNGVHQAAFGDIAFKQEGTYQFVVTENDLAEGIEGVAKDTSEKIITVKVEKGDNGLVATLVDEQSDDLTFTNTADLTISGSSALQVIKNLHASAVTADMVQAGEGTYDFTITAQATEGEGQPTAAEAAAKLGLTGEDGSTDTTLEFSNDVLTQGTGDNAYVWSDTMNPLSDITFTAADRGKTFTYVVDEVEPVPVPTGYVFDTATHTVTYTVSSNTSEALSVEVRVDDGQPVNADTTPSVTFDNRIQAGTIGGDGADTALKVQKTTNVATEKDFEFALTLQSAVDGSGANISKNAVYEIGNDGALVPFDGMTTTVSDAFTAEKENTAAFDRIIFTQPGTYTFQVAEVLPSEGTEDGWNYDAPQTITVTVDDNYSVSVNPESATVAFENTYGASGSLTLEGLTKALEGRDWMEGDGFTFTLSGKNVTEGADSESGFTLPETTEVTVDYDAAVAEAGEGNATEGIEVPFSFDPISFTQTGTYEFTVTEDASSIDEPNVTNTSGSVTYQVEVADNTQDGQLEIGDPAIVSQSGSSNFVNTYNPNNATSNLTAVKTLNGSSEGLEEGAFTFRIEAISAPEGSTASLPTGVTADDGADAATVGTVTNDVDGVISFGQFLFDAEGEYEYQVAEVDEGKGGYIYDDAIYTVVFEVSDDPSTGSLVASPTIYQGADTTGDTVEAITFANGYQPESITTSTDATFSGTKTVTEEHGDFALEAGQFSFTMTSTSTPNGIDAPVPSEGSTVSIAEDGSFDFGTLTFVEPGEYTYAVSEDKPSQGIDGVTYSSEVYTLYFNVVDNDGQLEIETQTIADADGNTVDAGSLNFTNIYNDGEAGYSIAGVKVLETNGYSGEALTEGEYSFALYEVTEDGSESLIQTVTNGAPSGNGNTAAFQFDTITYTEAGTHTYKVYELGTDGEPGTGGTDTDNVSYSKEVYTITVTVSESNDGRGLSVSSDVQNSDFVFTNTYTPESAVVGPNGDAQIIGTKILNAADGTDRTLGKDEFTFVLLDENGEEVSSTTNAADGSFVFDDLTFDKADTYSYTVAEKNENAGGITYDDSLYGVTISVTEDTEANALVAEVSYSKDNQATEDMIFTNDYEALPVHVQLGVSKELQNTTLAANQFTFELSGSEGAPMPEATTATNTENGQVLFGEIAFDTVGEYDYTITEVNDGQEGVTYDADATRTIHVSVTDNGEGALEAEISYGEDGSHFVNIGTPVPDEPTDGTDPEDGDNTNGGSSDEGEGEGKGKDEGEGPLESLAKTGDTWLPILLAAIAIAAVALSGFAAYRMKQPNSRR